MKIDTDYLRRHYAELSDEALAEIDRNELVEAAQKCYDEEVASRSSEQSPAQVAAQRSVADNQDGPDWLESAECVCSYVSRPGGDGALSADEAREALIAAGVPCQVILEDLPDSAGQGHEYRVVVPAARNFEAISILDLHIFNPRVEAEWAAHFAALTDEELRAVSPDIICAGFLDRAARLKRAYETELAHRTGDEA